MPAKPTWLLRLPEIIDSLERLDVTVIDRALCERLFGIRRRRAIDLMRQFGGYQVGRTYLTNRSDFVDRLRVIAGSPEFLFESQRKEKLAAKLDEVRRHTAGARVRIPVTVEDVGRRLPSLPDGVFVSEGVLSIAYGTTEQLLTRLYALARAAANDFDAFQSVMESGAGARGPL